MTSLSDTKEAGAVSSGQGVNQACLPCRHVAGSLSGSFADWQAYAQFRFYAPLADNWTLRSLLWMAAVFFPFLFKEEEKRLSAKEVNLFANLFYRHQLTAMMLNVSFFMFFVSALVMGEMMRDVNLWIFAACLFPLLCVCWFLSVVLVGDFYMRLSKWKAFKQILAENKALETFDNAASVQNALPALKHFYKDLLPCLEFDEDLCCILPVKVAHPPEAVRLINMYIRAYGLFGNTQEAFLAACDEQIWGCKEIKAFREQIKTACNAYLDCKSRLWIDFKPLFAFLYKEDLENRQKQDTGWVGAGFAKSD